MEDNTLLYDEILKNGPSQSTLHIVLTRIKDEGRSNEVVKWCIAFLRVYPKDVYLRMLLAESYLDLGLIGQSETEFVKVLSYMNDLLAAHKRLAEIYEKQKRFKEAEAHAKIFLAHHPEDSDMGGLHNRVKVVEKAAAGGAEELDQEWPVLPDGDDESLVAFATPTIAELYFSQGQLDAAVATYEQVVEEHPDDTASAERLLKLKDQLKTSLSGTAKEYETVHGQEERLIAVLEKWLPRVGEIKYG
ncbi:MAG: tetratricopeptide repeat protein [Deltaproteobacteria bacterium]|nr:tetratricopeptide repeat protein [Deltaproteobacteria bacterium]